jgi:hypothetical protein
MSSSTKPTSKSKSSKPATKDKDGKVHKLSLKGSAKLVSEFVYLLLPPPPPFSSSFLPRAG